jgi:hypothetical protein
LYRPPGILRHVIARTYKRLLEKNQNLKPAGFVLEGTEEGGAGTEHRAGTEKCRSLLPVAR